MNDEKIIFLSKRLKEEHIVYFRLYNALYRITITNNQIFLRQESLDTIYKYSSLKELLQNHIVYGNTLIESLNDIKFV